MSPSLSSSIEAFVTRLCQFGTNREAVDPHARVTAHPEFVENKALFLKHALPADASPSSSLCPPIDYIKTLEHDLQRAQEWNKNVDLEAIFIDQKFWENKRLVFNDDRLKAAIREAAEKYHLNDRQRTYLEKKAYAPDRLNPDGVLDFEGFQHMLQSAFALTDITVSFAKLSPEEQERSHRKKIRVVENILSCGRIKADNDVSDTDMNAYDFFILSAAQLRVTHTLVKENVLRPTRHHRANKDQLLDRLKAFEESLIDVATTTYSLADHMVQSSNIPVRNRIQPNIIEA